MLYLISGITHVSQKPKLSDNFFHIGGTSINAVAAVAKINQHFQITIENFISARSIEDLVNEDSNIQKKETLDWRNPTTTEDIEVSLF